MRFHVVNLPHIPVSDEHVGCAYSQRTAKFIQAMKGLGHHVTLYAAEGSETVADEQVTVITREDQERIYGTYDHEREFYRIVWDANHEGFRLANSNTIAAIGERLGDRDIICLVGGVCHQPIADAFPNHQSVEFAVGYKGTFTHKRAFESYAWMHWVYGSQNDDNGHSYDVVVPNHYDPEAYPFNHNPDDYFLFMARLVSRKGLTTAVEATRASGDRLIIAGQGVTEWTPSANGKPARLVTAEGEWEGDHIDYIGFAGADVKAELLGKARGLFSPTVYVEPFGGVHVEAMMTGTPVITTDWGVYSETVIDRVNGFRTRTLGEAVWATQNVDQLSRLTTHSIAKANYSIERAAHQYQAWFEQLDDLHGDGWYGSNHEGTSLMGRYLKASQ